MKDLQRDFYNQNRDTEPGRARKRKIRRTGADVLSAQTERPGDMAGARRERVAHRELPSARERKVNNEISNRADETPSIRGKLSSRLGLNSQPSSERSKSRRRSQAQAPREENVYESTPRAETQRITNPEHGYLPPKNRRVYDTRAEAAPPVMVRGGMSGMAFGRVATSRLNKAKTPKRRIDVPLRVTGAEIRLPAIPFMNLGWRAVSLFMVVMATISLLLMWKAPVFQVKAIEADGLKRLTVNDLNVVMGTFGKSVFSLNPGLLRDTLSQAFPEFSKISVRINLPASVKVVVTERQPIIDWKQAGVESWVDGEGISFPVRGVSKNALVQVEGYGTQPTTAEVAETSAQQQQNIIPLPGTPNKPSLRLSPELISSILALGAKMPEGTVLVYDSERGLGWNDPNGWEVFFGNENQDMEMKLVVYQALVDRLKSEGIQPALISVEYVHAPYYRMER